MNIVIFKTIAIVVIIAAALFWWFGKGARGKFRERVSNLELLIFFSAILLLMTSFIVTSNILQSVDTKYSFNKQIVSATYVKPYESYDQSTCSETYLTLDSDGDPTIATRWVPCMECITYSFGYSVDGQGNTSTISSSEFNNIAYAMGGKVKDVKFNYPRNETEDCNRLDGVVQIDYDNDPSHLYLTTRKEPYKNRVRNSYDIVHWKHISHKKAKANGLFEREYSDGLGNAKVLYGTTGLSSVDAALRNELLLALRNHPEKVWFTMVIFQNKPQEIAEMQYHYWKVDENEMQIYIGIDSTGHIMWNRAYHWNKGIDLNDFVENQFHISLPVTPALANNLSASLINMFHPISFDKEFGKVALVAPIWLIVLYVIFIIGLGGWLVWYLINNKYTQSSYEQWLEKKTKPIEEQLET